MPFIRGNDLKQGSAIVRNAIRHGIVPDYKPNVPFRDQTPRTQWVLHVLAALSRDGRVDMRVVKHVIERIEDLLDHVTPHA